MPAATTPRLTVTWRTPSTLREIEAVNEDGIASLGGQLTLVLNRFSAPEKSKGCKSCDIVLLNVVAFCNAAGKKLTGCSPERIIEKEGSADH